jgi:hypothetical protein
MFGAFCACLHSGDLSWIGCCHKIPSMVMTWFRMGTMPCLMAAALLLRKRSLFFALFFLKGMAAAFSLCLIFLAGYGLFSIPVSTFFFESTLPLPILFAVGSVWSGRAEQVTAELWLLAPVLLFMLLVIGLEAVLF